MKSVTPQYHPIVQTTQPTLPTLTNLVAPPSFKARPESKADHSGSAQDES